jgi:hypothetical protein
MSSGSSPGGLPAVLPITTDVWNRFLDTLSQSRATCNKYVSPALGRLFWYPKIAEVHVLDRCQKVFEDLDKELAKHLKWGVISMERLILRIVVT